MIQNKLICGDCLTELEKIPSASVDLVFADPPYFLQLGSQLLRPDNTKVSGVQAGWDSFKDFAEYDAFTQKWLSEVRRVLKPNGAVWVIGTYHNIFRIGSLLQNLGFWILNDVVWTKTNPMPNFRGTRLTNAHETLIWAARSDKSKPVFHYESMKVFNDDHQLRSDWYLPVCAGEERLKNHSGKTLHPTQKPESLLYRIVLMTTNPGDVILDPFAGTGTTLAVAKKMGRRFIGIEADENYVQAARERLKKIKSGIKKDYLNPIQKKERLNIPFGALLEHGFIRAGDRLTDTRHRFTAVVCSDGSIRCGEKRGSIHQMGAWLTGVGESVNGWFFWVLLRPKQKTEIVLDTLRQQLFKKLSS